MGSQTEHGYPYPVGTDRVMDGDDAIRALAEKVEANLVGGVFSGSVTVPNVATNTSASVAVTFPVGRFTATPIVTASPLASNPRQLSGCAGSVTASGMTIYGGSTYPSTVSVVVAYTAHQQG